MHKGLEKINGKYTTNCQQYPTPPSNNNPQSTRKSFERNEFHQTNGTKNTETCPNKCITPIFLECNGASSSSSSSHIDNLRQESRSSPVLFQGGIFGEFTEQTEHQQYTRRQEYVYITLTFLRCYATFSSFFLASSSAKPLYICTRHRKCPWHERLCLLRPASHVASLPIPSHLIPCSSAIQQSIRSYAPSSASLAYLFTTLHSNKSVPQ